MRLLRAISRPLLAGIFISGGFDTFRHPEPRLPRATSITGPIASALPGVDEITLVRANAALQMGAGVMLARGHFPKLSAALLAASLIPTTAAGHRFWEESEPATRAQQRTHFLKNVAVLGGLLAVVAGPSENSS
jgi:putative oxidoreductase